MPFRQGLPPSAADDMPEPSAALTALGAHQRALLKVMKPKDRKRYLDALVETYEEYEGSGNVVRLRHPRFDCAVTKARRSAFAWTRAMFAAFFMLDVDRKP
jgi:hypothetical protein